MDNYSICCESSASTSMTPLIYIKQQLASRFAYLDYVRRTHRLIGCEYSIPPEFKNVPTVKYPLNILDIPLELNYGYILEFGVYQGVTFNRLCRNWRWRFNNIYGFDSFQGLPDNWEGNGGMRAGTFKTKIPPCPRGGKYIIGEFKNTIPDWMNGRSQPIALAHIDCDLYSSALFVLNTIKPLLITGSTLIFDEFFGTSEHWRYSGECAALIDSGIKCIPIYLCPIGQQIAFRCV